MEEKRKINVLLSGCNEDNIFVALNTIFAQKGFDDIAIRTIDYNLEDDTERLLKKYALDNNSLEVIEPKDFAKYRNCYFDWPEHIGYAVNASDTFSWTDENYLCNKINELWATHQEIESKN